MDERSVDWLRLLPPGARFTLERPPSELRNLLSPRIGPGANAYLSWRPKLAQLPALDAYQSVVLVNPRGITPETLRTRGFAHTLAVCALPSLADPRVYAPLDNRAVAASALDFFTPYRLLPRLKRELSALLARLGQLGRLGDTLLLGRRTDSELERWLATATGLERVYLAISPGSIGFKRKLTMQVTRVDGHVVGFTKLATSAAARRTLEAECVWLRELSAHAELTGRIPRLIDSVISADASLTFLSPGPSGIAPARFGAAHAAFLATITAATRRMLSFDQSAMCASMHASLSALEPRLSVAWRARLASTLQRVAAMLGEAPLSMSLAHRDFQPGNMRQFPGGRLFVYDWEGAQPECTPLYDLFNFTFLESVRRGTSSAQLLATVTAAARRWQPNVDERLLPICFAAYLADHALRRLTNSDLARDARSVFVLEAIAALLDGQGAWLSPAHRAPNSVQAGEGVAESPT